MTIISKKPRGYRGNHSLKKVGETFEWTAEMVQEYMKCASDPVYFIETYMKIINVDKGIIPFTLYDYQEEIATTIHNNRFTIICCARQAGKSTIMIGYILWYALFNPYVVVALLANKEKTALELLGKARIAYPHIPKFLQQGIVEGEWNKGSIGLENGSRIIADSTTGETARGYAINFLVLDETAHIEHWDEFSASVLPTISSGKTTKIVQISTPKGLNHFYLTWTNAIEGRNDYKPIMIKWDRVPGRDEKWKEDTLRELNSDMQKFDQEFNCEFQGSSGTLIAGWKLKELRNMTPLFHKDGLSKYYDPIKKHQYFITIDVAEGKGLDFSAFHVVDTSVIPWQQACVFRSNKITPRELADIVHQTAIAYNEALILIEYKSLGPELADILFHDLEYEHILRTEPAGARGKKVTLRVGRSVDMGINMSKTVKLTGCSMLKLLIEQNRLVINDFHTIEELARFSRKGISWEAEEGSTDDLVMALVVFAWLSNQEYFKELINVNIMSELRDRGQQQVEEELVPFGFGPRDPDEDAEPVPYRSWLFPKDEKDKDEIENQWLVPNF